MESELQIPTTVIMPRKTVRQVHTSVLLKQLIDGLHSDQFTIEWLVSNLPKHSFGVIMLFLGLISILPVISLVAQPLISLLAIQIIVGYHSPVLPRRLARHPLPSRYLVRLEHYAIPALQELEKVVKPRWEAVLFGMRRLTAFVALLLTVMSLLTPIPMVNIPPAVISVLLALSYIEHDGLMLSIALTLALALLGFVAYLIW